MTYSATDGHKYHAAINVASCCNRIASSAVGCSAVGAEPFVPKVTLAIDFIAEQLIVLALQPCIYGCCQFYSFQALCRFCSVEAVNELLACLAS